MKQSFPTNVVFICLYHSDIYIPDIEVALELQYAIERMILSVPPAHDLDLEGTDYLNWIRNDYYQELNSMPLFVGFIDPRKGCRI